MVLKWVLFALSGAFLIVTSNCQPKLIATNNAGNDKLAPKSKEMVE